MCSSMFTLRLMLEIDSILELMYVDILNDYFLSFFFNLVHLVFCNWRN